MRGRRGNRLCLCIEGGVERLAGGTGVLGGEDSSNIIRVRFGTLHVRISGWHLKKSNVND